MYGDPRMYNIAIVVRPCDNGYCIADMECGDSILIIDLDSGDERIVEKPVDADGFEDFIEEYNPAILICGSIDIGLRGSIEEMGVKVISNVCGSVSDFLKRIL